MKSLILISFIFLISCKTVTEQKLEKSPCYDSYKKYLSKVSELSEPEKKTLLAKNKTILNITC